MQLKWPTAALMITVLVCSGFAQQQTKPKTPTAPAKAPVVTEKAAAATPASEPKLPDESTVLAFYNRMFGFQPNLTFKLAQIKWSDIPGMAEVTVVAQTPEGSQISKLYVSSDGKHAISGDLIPFGKDPYAENRRLLAGAFGPTRGSAMPEVTIVEFADLQCPGCKATQPIMDKLMGDVSNARLIFQSFPLPQHDWAKQAAGYLDCLGRTSNDAALTFEEAVFSHQGEITVENAEARFKNYVQMAKADPEKISACAATQETKDRVQKSIDLGQKMKLTGTPTLFINGRPINNVQSLPYEVLKAIVEFEASQGAK